MRKGTPSPLPLSCNLFPIHQRTSTLSTPLLRLLRHARHYRSRVIRASLYSILNKVFDLAPPFLIGGAVDKGTLTLGAAIAMMGTIYLVIGSMTLLCALFLTPRDVRRAASVE